jgi:hypothetical protein
VLALVPIQTEWFRVEIGTVPLTQDEARELRELDVVLADLPAKPGTGELVLSTGERYSVALSAEGDSWIVKVGERVAPRLADDLAFNLVFRLCDSRELPAQGTTITLDVTGESFVLSWKDSIIGYGHNFDVEGERGVRVSSRRVVSPSPRPSPEGRGR